MEEVLPTCICSKPFDPERCMIPCDICKVWFHAECLGLKEYQVTEVDKFHCPRCQPQHGPTQMKARLNWHRHNYSEPGAESKPVQTGTVVFVRELKSRHFPRADDIVKHLRGQQLTMQYLQTNGFDVPIIVDSKDGLDMLVPPPNFSLYDIENHIGGDREMDVIDVSRQNNIRMKLRDFVEYFNDPERSRILNLISLEFTNTGLSPLVEAPYIARKLDWVNYVWPRDWPEDSELKKPEVQKYCLIGVKDSFTDFHVDFGGTSVWYHVLRGEKIFYLIKPTPANLHLYQQWMCSSTQSETFFGDQVDACYKCVVKQGHTMLIPTGWIHAVLTPMDSLVFGGNFIHSLNIPMQIQIYEIERKMKTPAKFQYPGFETIHWFAAKRLLKELKDLNSEQKKCPSYFLQGVKALLCILKQWNTDKDYSMVSRGHIPNTVNSQKVLKDLSKEIRHAERFLMVLNPPKPERESKRKKKKPFNKDFVDFNVADRVAENLKVKPQVKVQSPKKEIVPGNKSLTNRPPLKLTLPKAVTLPFVQDNVAEAPIIPVVTSPVKKIKTLSPKTPSKATKRAPASKGSKVIGSKVTGGKVTGSSKKAANPSKISSPKKTGTTKKKTVSETKKTTAKHGKQSPTVIRFKLGDKEVVRSTKDKGNNIYGNFTLDHAVETRKELTWKQTSSVYDFHDGSNESDYGGFTIDEAPKKKKTQKQQVANLPKKLKRSFEQTSELQGANITPKNGIEELLKASAYTLGTNAPRLDVIPSGTVGSFVQPAPASTGSGRASPSTRDAIAGMLSFSAQCYSTTPETPPKPAKALKLKPVVEEHDEDDDLLIENMDKVHQDDDFIYPALDVSDEDEFMFKSKGKREEDEAWNPKARVGPLLPKTNRPPREGARKTSVEKGLEAAAKKRSKQSDRDYEIDDDDDGDDDDDYMDDEMEKVVKKKLGTSKRTYKKKRKDPVPIQTGGTTPAVPTPTVSGAVQAIDSVPNTPAVPTNTTENTVRHIPYSSILTSPNRLKDVKAKLAAPIPVERKPKKGMKTAKQRLGKILKIHKMLH